jgi:hypothetical protein
VSNCGNCGSFNAFSWRRPLNVSGLSDPSPAHPQKVLAVIPSPEINLTSINKTT